MQKSAAGEFFWISDLKYYDFFTKFVENTEFLPKFYIHSQNIYGIFGAGPKISTIYMEIPYMSLSDLRSTKKRTISVRKF